MCSIIILSIISRATMCRSMQIDGTGGVGEET